jgi:uncharacterized membrane protein
MAFLGRFLRHVAMTPWTARRCFPDADLDAIQSEVAAGEKRHRGEVRFVVEAELTTAQLWRGLDSRARAIEVFSMLQVWNTEENSGILVYVLLADHKVEIIADRGIQARVSAGEWRAICASMEERFREGRYREGALAGVKAATGLLAAHFPARETNLNELPDRPVRL